MPSSEVAPASGDRSDLSSASRPTPSTSWLDDAACGSLPIEQLGIFFVKGGQTLGPRAVALCERCTVSSQCRSHAEALDIAHGYFGGVSASSRRAQGPSAGTENESL